MSHPSTSLPPDEAVRILTHWGIDASPDDVRPGSGTANASAVVTTQTGRFMLRRRNPRYARTDWVCFDHALLTHLVADGLPVPRGVPREAGPTWLRDGERVYELFEFIEGDQHHEGDAGELRSAGEVLARLHQSAADYEPPLEKSWPRFHDPNDLPAWIEPRIREAAGEDVTVLQDALSLAGELVDRVSDDRYWRLPQTVVQGDYHPANLKFRDGEVVGVFDWDWASRQPRMVDVADGLLFFCGVRRAPLIGGDIWSLTEAFEIDIARVERFLGGYAGRLALQAEELAALPDLMRCRWLYCRADAAHRKVEDERRVEFLTRDLATPLRAIDEIEAKLSGLKSLKE